MLKIIKILQSKTRMIYLLSKRTFMEYKKTDIVRKLAQMLLTTFNCHDSAKY